MGRDKAFLEIDGKTFLQNSVEILKPVCENRIKIVLNTKQTHFIGRLPENVAHIFDTHNNRGPLGGIHSALKDCKTEFAFILACDMPLVTNDAIVGLAAAALTSDCDAIVPRQPNEMLQPLCAVYRPPRSTLLIDRIINDHTNASVRKYISLLKTVSLIFDDAQLFFNANEPTDLNQLGSKK